jgi:hypothetical protein
MECPCHP